MKTKHKKDKRLSIEKLTYNFEKYIDNVYLGETYLITENDKIVAKLIPYSENMYMKEIEERLEKVNYGKNMD